MSDIKISQLPRTSTISPGDLLLVVSNPSTSPVTQSLSACKALPIIGGSGFNSALSNNTCSAYANIANSCYSLAIGGRSNTASGANSTVAGGFCNTASGANSTVAGGFCNNASCNYSNVAGGGRNTACRVNSNVAGGYCNTASGYYSNVAGGFCNNASGNYSNVAGGFCNNACDYSNVAGGCCNNACDYSNVAGGFCNTASGYCSNVAGGYSNCASCNYSNVAGGISNIACGVNSNVAGGYSNTASGYNSNVAGGIYNTACGNYSFIAGGQKNHTKGFSNTFILGSSLSATQADTTYVNSVIASGVTSLTATLNTAPLTIVAAAKGSVFESLQNTFAGVSASSDISVYNDTTNYLDMGIASSAYNGNLFGPIFNVVGAGDSYLYTTANDLIIGTSSPSISSDIVFFTGGTLSGTSTNSGNERFRITNTAGTYSGNVGVNTATPNQQLTVSGSISSTAMVYASTFSVGLTATGAVGGSNFGKFPIYSSTGVLLGYVPIYQS